MKFILRYIIGFLQILARDDLCVESEGVLLDLVLRWAEDKVRE